MQKYLRIIIFLFFTIAPFIAYAHEPWLLSNNEMAKLAQQPVPTVFSEWGTFNIVLCLVAIAFIIFWINTAKTSHLLTNKKIKWSLRALRITTGVMLFCLSLGYFSKVGFTAAPSLFAPDLIIPANMVWLKWAERIIGTFLLLGFLVRFTAFFGIILLGFAFYLFGTALWQYAGFYLGIFLFLFRESRWKFLKPNINATENSIILLQVLTGLNFIYSAITMKLMQPNFDIALLAKHHAFTFGLPYDYFVLVMCIVELTLGILIVFGQRLASLAWILIVLFTFLSWNVSENLFSHLFIYGILITFIIC